MLRPIFNRRLVILTLSAAVVCASAATAAAQTAPSLGVARQFGALGRTGVTAAGVSRLVIGDVGSSPTPTVLNVELSNIGAPFVIHNENDRIVRRARKDATAAYVALLRQGSGTVLPDDLGSVGKLTSGVYSFEHGAPVLPAYAALTLDGNGVFIFNVDRSLTTEALSSVVGTADPCYVYWRVGGSAELDGSIFHGTVIANENIRLGDGVKLAGRALAGAGAPGVVTIGNGSTIGDCSVVTMVPWKPTETQLLLLFASFAAAWIVHLKNKARDLPEW